MIESYQERLIKRLITERVKKDRYADITTLTQEFCESCFDAYQIWLDGDFNQFKKRLNDVKGVFIQKIKDVEIPSEENIKKFVLKLITSSSLINLGDQESGKTFVKLIQDWMVTKLHNVSSKN